MAFYKVRVKEQNALIVEDVSHLEEDIEREKQIEREIIEREKQIEGPINLFLDH